MEKSLGTIDSRIPQTEDWDAELSRGLCNNKSFIAILTPLYFNRTNCGKELAIFILRSPDLGINKNGSLTGVRNVMLIRWLPEEAYAANTEKESLIPSILRLIEDTPKDKGHDDDRTRAIERYRRKGMEKCVSVSPHYEELLDLFVAQIRDMSELPPSQEASFATAFDAFKYDWASHLKSPSALASGVKKNVSSNMLVAPRPLASLVAFYITRHPFTRDHASVSFADHLIAESLTGTEAAPDPTFEALLSDVRAAGIAEGLTVFHAAVDPAVPDSPESLLAYLVSLSESYVLTALIIDPAIWPGSADHKVTATIERVIHSQSWTGPVLLPILDKGAIDRNGLVAAHDLPRRLVVLPQASEVRAALLRRAFVETRGRVLRLSTGHALDAEHLPVLKNTSVKPVGIEHG